MNSFKLSKLESSGIKSQKTFCNQPVTVIFSEQGEKKNNRRGALKLKRTPIDEQKPYYPL